MKSVLIIDDQGSIRTLLKRFLENDYIVYLAENGKEGLATFKDHDIDIILTDIQMPDMDGYELSKAIRESSNVPIVYMSGYGMVMDRCVDNSHLIHKHGSIDRNHLLYVLQYGIDEGFGE